MNDFTSTALPSSFSSRRSPVDVAGDVVKNRYPDASFGFAAGSLNRGEATRFSDIDLVVIFPRLENAWRESFVFEGWPIEVFAHDPETLEYFFRDDARSGVPSLPAMVLEGITVPSSHPMASELKALAAQLLSGRPPQWQTETIDGKRYAISDLIDDLREPRNTLEAAATIGKLHDQLGNFYFRARGIWSASGKHIPRRLEQIDAELAMRWEKAFLDAFAGQRGGLISLSEEILRPYGGFLFDGYRQDAPREWRVNTPTRPFQDG